MRHDEYAQHDATSLAGLIAAGDVSGKDVLKAALKRTDEVNGQINAVVERWDAEALAKIPDDGAFAGVPMLVKDMDGFLANKPCTFSSRSLRDYRPDTDSELFVRYKKAGFNIFGKTNCPEFGLLGITEPELRGPARNPWNLNHTPGGSSGGSAAAVAAGIVPVAHGGDGGGSLRIPASHTGIFGLKTSRGLTPLGPHEGEAWDGLVSRLLMSRSVRDTAGALDVAVSGGTDAGAPYSGPVPAKSYRQAHTRAPKKLRIGFSTKSIFGRELHREAIAAVERSAVLLEELGHEVFEVDLPVSATEGAKAYLTIVAANMAAEIRWTQTITKRKPDPRDFERTTWFLNQVGQNLSAADLAEARQWCHQTGRRFATIFGHQFDVHLSSTVAAPPVAIGELQPSAVENVALSALQRVGPGQVLRRVLDGLAADSLEATPNTQVYNMTGQPAASVPMHVTDAGLPLGVQIAASYGDDLLLLQLAAQMEKAAPWDHKLPLTGRL